MSKKINLSKKYLNVTNLSNYQLQYYGKLTLFYKQIFPIIFTLLPLLHRKLFVNSKNFSNITTLSLGSLNNSIYLLLSFSALKKEDLLYFWDFFSYLKKIIVFSVKVSIYLEKNYYLSINFLKNYIFYLNIKLNYSPKKVFNLLIIFLTNCLTYKTICLTRNGFRRKALSGFKIQLKGRYESSKSSMSKALTFKLGKVNSTKLNSNISFLYYTFYTKLGVSNLKIWLFYKFY